MAKIIVVTEKNLNEFKAYHESTSKRLTIGEVLHVVSANNPYVRITGSFAIVTDWQPSINSLRMISEERVNHVDAEKYGWKFSAQVLKQTLAEKKESYAFNRWSINMKFIK